MTDSGGKSENCEQLSRLLISQKKKLKELESQKSKTNKEIENLTEAIATTNKRLSDSGC
jgi:hypothetical protein